MSKTKIPFSKLDKIGKNLKRTEFLFNEFFVTKEKYRTLAFLRRDGKGWLLLNKLMYYYYSKKELSVENLHKEITTDRNVCSRATLNDYIKNCLLRKILTKTPSPKDKRIIILKPTPEFVDEFERWSDEFYSDDNWEMKTDYKKL
jgi:DNA-binding MarR family transcriptional regulator